MSDPLLSRPNSLPWPPMILVLMVGIGWFLGDRVPLGWPGPPMSEFLTFLGIMLFLGALCLDIWAMRTLHNHKTTIMPHRGSDALVTSGPFGFSRNPIYLGNVVLVFSLALIIGNLWYAPLAFIGGFLTAILAIKREEAHLAQNFPRNWVAYQKKVRRWF